MGRASGLHNCASVTDAHLAAITGDSDLSYRGLTELREGDLAGLSKLDGLNLRYNRLKSLPEGAFDDLAALGSLKIDNNQLAALPEGVFSELDSLKTLWLNNNRLTVAPAGLFDGLDTLQTLYLFSNGFTTLPRGLFADLTSMKFLWLDHAVDPKLCDRPQEKQDTILGKLPDISDCRLVTDSDVDSLSLPNIILIMADDLGYGDLGSYGQATIKTPELDAMAAAGMRFTDFYSGHTVCSASREALLTGMHTGHTAVRDLLRTWHPLDQRICDTRDTLGEMLQSAGYRTAVIGKWGVGGESTPAQPNDQGFDYFYGYLNHGIAGNPYPDMLYRNKELVQLANVLELDRPRSLTPVDGGSTKPKAKLEFPQDLFMEEALKFIEESSDTGMPFFLYLPVTIPHTNGPRIETPLEGYGQYADESWNQSEKGFAAVISYLDKDVGRLMDKLEELGIANDTVTFFTSDNGAHNQGATRRGTSTAPARSAAGRGGSGKVASASRS